MPTLTFSAEHLTAAVNAARAIIDTKSTLEAAKCIAIRASGGRVSFAATDLTQGVSLSYPCEGDGAWLLDLGRLDAFTKALPKAAMVRVTGDQIATLKAGALTSRIQSLRISDFPDLLDPPADGWVRFPANSIVNTMARLQAGCERSGSYIEQAVHVLINGCDARVEVAQRALAFIERLKAETPGNISVMLNYTGVNTISSLFDGVAVSLAKTGGMLWVKSDAVTFYTKCVDAEPRDLSALEPSCPEYASVDVASMKAAARAARSIGNDKLSSVYVSVGGIGTFIGAAKHADALCVPFQSDGASEITTSVSADKLDALLTACGRETIGMAFASGCGNLTTSHVQAKSDSFLGLLMPLLEGFHKTKPIIDAYLGENSATEAQAA